MKILVPIDFSKNSIKALELAIGLNRGQKSTILLIHVVELVYDFASQAALAVDAMHKEAHKLLDELEQTYNSDNLAFQKIIVEGTASISIARIALESDVNLIVIGSSGAGGLSKLVTGSTTINLLKEARTPILIVPNQVLATQVLKLVMAIQYSNHEKPLLDQIILFKRNWEMELEFLHITSALEFKSELAGIGLTTYLKNHYEIESVTITDLTSDSTIEGINTYFQSNKESILIMCHEHKSIWKHFIESSHSIAVANRSEVPILVMN